MFLTLLEIAIVAGLTIYLGISHFMIRRRQAQAWNILVKQLDASGIAAEFCGPSLTGEHAHLPKGRRWRIQSAHDLWSMYEGARVMLDMANFAAVNSANIDQELLTELRRDAMKIRVCVLAELSRQTRTQVSENAGENLARAATVYTEMVSRMAELLRANNGILVPAAIPTA